VTSNDLKIVISVPTLDVVPSEVLPGLLIAAAEVGRVGNPMVMCPVNLKPHDRARNWAMQNALNYDANLLWFIDSDTDVPPGSFGRLKEVMDRTGAVIVAGYYLQRGYPFLSTWAVVADDGKMNYRMVGDTTSDPIKLDACGMGCTLINVDWVRENMDDLDGKWFKLTEKNNRRVWEDVYFCMRASERGGTIFGDPRVVGRHLYERIFVTPENAAELRRVQILKRHQETEEWDND